MIRLLIRILKVKEKSIPTILSKITWLHLFSHKFLMRGKLEFYNLE